MSQVLDMFLKSKQAQEMKCGEFKDGQNVVLKTSVSVLLDIVPFNNFPFPGCEFCICHPSGLSCAGLLDPNMH